MSFSISSTLEKMNSRDKDFRYMATADLVTELNKDGFKLDPDSEKKLTQAVLKLIEDNSNQVQELAVKCLGPLSKKVKEAQVQEIVDTLCKYLLDTGKNSDELRDIASIGLKTVITDIPNSNVTLATTVVKRLTPKLVKGIQDNEAKQDIVFVCLEGINDVLSKFGNLLVSDHEKILKVVQPQLSSKRPTARKRAIGCLGHLAVTIPDGLFNELVNHLVSNLKEAQQNSEELRTYIQAIGAISRSVGYRLGKFLGEICPIIAKYCDAKSADDDLRENCFQCFELLIFRCPKEITPFFSQINDLCLKYIKHDPNYVEDDEVEDMDTGEEDDEDVEEGEEDYSDDEDMSWKVRRAAAKCLSAMISTRPEMLQDFYKKDAALIIARFKEREENVKLDVFSTFIDLLKQTQAVSRRNPASASPLLAYLRELIPKIIASIAKQLKEKSKSVKIRNGAFSLLRELVLIQEGGLTEHIAALVPGILLALGDKHTSANLKIEGLVFLRILFSFHNPKAFHPHVKQLSVPLFKCIRDTYYRIAAEGLRVGTLFVTVLRPGDSNFDYKPYVKDLYTATLEKLKTQDIDQEVKENAINCMAATVANLGDELKPQLVEVLNILIDRLTNEITRLTAVKAFETIASSKLNIDLKPVLNDALKELSSFLRKTNRQLKQSSLITLVVLVKKYGADPAVANQLPNVLSEIAPLLSDSDLHLSHLALNLTTSILEANPKTSQNLVNEIYPKTLELFKSPLLQGLALQSLLQTYQTLVKTNIKPLVFDHLLDSFFKISSENLNKHVLSNIAKGVAAIVLASPDKRDNSISRFIKDLNKKEESSKIFALYCIGEIGKQIDLSSHTSLQQNILSAFEGPEEVKQAASYSLGNLAVGNLEIHLPKLLEEIKKNLKAKYLLLHSLREIIVSEKNDALKEYQGTILPLLFQNCESEEEGTRNVVAECLGKLAIISPNDLVPHFLEKIKSPSAHTRSTVVTALKFAIVEKPHDIDKLLLPNMHTFLDCIKDSDLNVRRNTLLALNYAAHNKPALIHEILPQYLPLLYGESVVKPELIREVDLGPFKHKVDDGLELRKAAFECMYTLLDSCLDRVDIPAFVANLVNALKDHYDIKMLAHLMLIRLTTIAGPALLEGLDQLVEPLRTTIITKPKEGAVKQEIERNDELIRSALRAIIAIMNVPNSESNFKFDEFLRDVVKQGEIGEKFNSIKAESNPEKIDVMDVS